MISYVFNALTWPLQVGVSNVTFFLSIVAVLLLWTVLRLRRRRNIPPGPQLLPVVGNIVSLASGDVLATFRDLWTKYGNIYSLYIGNELIVVLNGFDTIHDALMKKGSKFAFRPPAAFKKITEERPGFIYTNGKIWKERKNMIQKTLQEICLRNSARNIEEVIQVEVRGLLKIIENQTEPMDISEYVYHLGLNIMFVITYGKRFEFGDKVAINFAKTLNDVAQQVAKIQVLCNCCPVLQHLPGDLLGDRKRLTLRNKVLDFGTDLLNHHRLDRHNQNAVSGNVATVAQAYDEATSVYTDTYGRTDDCPFLEEERETTLLDLIGAGGDTTATAILWLLLYLVREQNVQEKLYLEILNVIGADTEPSLHDRKSMPYTEACILESLRIVASVPLAIPHSVTEETAFHGYVIPKDATVLANLTSALKDPEVWEDPDSFKPDRFLSADKTEVVTPKEFIAFSLGPRSCLGETLAKMEIFLAVTGLVQRYELLPASEKDFPDTSGSLGITYRPKPFSVVFSTRRAVG